MLRRYLEVTAELLGPPLPGEAPLQMITRRINSLLETEEQIKHLYADVLRLEAMLSTVVHTPTLSEGIENLCRKT